MKTLVILLFMLLSSIILNAQTTYYKNHKGKIVNEETVKNQKQKLYDKLIKLHKKTIVEIDIKNTEVKEDSIIHTYGISVNLNGEKMMKTKLRSLKGENMLDSPLITLDGSHINIGDLKGKPTLLNFWFTSCPPCIDEMPELNKLKKHFGKDVNFVAITYESKEKVEKFLKKHNFDFVQVVDAKKYTDELEMKAFPKNVILDENGIVKSIEGGISYVKTDDGKLKMGEATALKNKLEKLLK
ncbi:TlpA disulfide reductase family protein [Aquimarina sp. MMG016]|uniref:TlpA family protein disulfide reductase n=1 Tax=Aquimarina sp. MMG016 TaxID=2822690 RepID=UPI001B3A25C6|nr:TlpA disulfide reductase family protein [Aquimarina sp. MMG016]MBQ4818502.1 TlpA family protein disulfide reductase [Aquimarina sp. MMG016]